MKHIDGTLTDVGEEFGEHGLLALEILPSLVDGEISARDYLGADSVRRLRDHLAAALERLEESADG